MTAHRKLFTLSLLLPASLLFASCTRDDASVDDGLDPEVGVAIQLAAEGDPNPRVNVVTEAPTGFDNQSNGVTDEAGFEEALDVFDEVDVIADGLGPCYNAQGCRECHQTPVSGAAAVTGEFRAGHFNGINFVDHPGGSLLNDRAIDASIQERIAAGQEVRTFRISLSLMGDGFVECTDSNTLVAITNAQPVALRGTVIQVPVLEAPGQIRVGRFGHKNQQASLLSFSADAYVNGVGITSPLQPNENTSNGVSVAGFDTVADPEDDGGDIQLFADFMRSLKAPPRGPITAAVTRGEAIFNSATLQCAICHGADLKGLGDLPSIAGRSPSYVVRQLYDIQNGARAGRGAQLMKAAVANLTVEDMASIAAYLASRTQ